MHVTIELPEDSTPLETLQDRINQAIREVAPPGTILLQELAPGVKGVTPQILTKTIQEGIDAFLKEREESFRAALKVYINFSEDQ